MPGIRIGIGLDDIESTAGAVDPPQPMNIPMSWDNGRGGEIAMHWQNSAGNADGDRMEWSG